MGAMADVVKRNTAALMPRARARVLVSQTPAAEQIRREVEKGALKAAQDLVDIMDHGEPFERSDARRTLLLVWTKLQTLMAEDGQAMPMTPEERAARLVELVAAMPPELEAALVAAGWRRTQGHDGG